MNTLLPDILRFLVGEYLDYSDTLRFYQVSKYIHQALSFNETIWWCLVKRFLTQQLRPSMHNKQPRILLNEFYRNNDIETRLSHAAERGYELFIEENLTLIVDDE